MAEVQIIFLGGSCSNAPPSAKAAGKVHAVTNQTRDMM